MEEGSVDRPRVVSANTTYQDSETDQDNQSSSHTWVQANITNIPLKALIGLTNDNTGKMPSLLLDHMPIYTGV